MRNRFKYRRPLLKLSGEMLGGPAAQGLHRATLQSLARQIAGLRRAGVEMALVVGGGNIFRGHRNDVPEISKPAADDIGMLATLINALALREYIAAEGAPCTVLSALDMPKIADRFTVRRARELLAEGHALILAGGTGNPFFTTDTAAALRAAELDADVLLKATNVEGVYSKDPRTHADAVLYRNLDFHTVIANNLAVMDTSAVALCRDANIPIVVFNLLRPRAIAAVLRGQRIGTLVQGNPKQ
ncbi:MAG: UMP kinase [Candidatus Sumerlaeia bacterium]|nr:UMP kinase [Candidatus Sumerlaeia bacterium]